MPKPENLVSPTVKPVKNAPSCTALVSLVACSKDIEAVFTGRLNRFNFNALLCAFAAKALLLTTPNVNSSFFIEKKEWLVMKNIFTTQS